MIDTSALVAGLVTSHQFHALARPRLKPDLRVPAIVLAETYGQLRRTFSQSPENASALLAPWTTAIAVLPTAAETVARIFARAVELGLGGNIHDALIAQTCIDHGLSLVTLDRRQHAIALTLGARSTYLAA